MMDFLNAEVTVMSSFTSVARLTWAPVSRTPRFGQTAVKVDRLVVIGRRVRRVIFVSSAFIQQIVGSSRSSTTMKVILAGFRTHPGGRAGIGAGPTYMISQRNTKMEAWATLSWLRLATHTLCR